MSIQSHKAARRALLELLYHAYLDDPLRMVEPEVFFETTSIDRDVIIPNMHYLSDRGLVEMMMGYSPPLFSAVRIKPAGIDLVENRFEFDRQFPGNLAAEAGTLQSVPALLERLVEEADFIPVDGVARQQLLSDVLYLREELSRPVERWRLPLVQSVMDAIETTANGAEMDALERLRQAVIQTVRS